MTLHRRHFLQAAAALPLAAGCTVSDSPDVVDPAEMPKPDLKIGNIPLLTKLRQLEPEIIAKVPGGKRGLDAVGLNLRLHFPHGKYFNRPSNSRMFAETLGDGVQFSLLVDDLIDESLPVVMTVPSFGANVIVARNVADFLSFGLIRGYFQMEQIAYQPKHALDAYNNADWRRPANSTLDYSVGPSTRAILDFIAANLKLQPLAQPAAVMQKLQDEFLPRLQFSERHIAPQIQFVGA